MHRRLTATRHMEIRQAISSNKKVSVHYIQLEIKVLGADLLIRSILSRLQGPKSCDILLIDCSR